MKLKATTKIQQAGAGNYPNQPMPVMTVPPALDLTFADAANKMPAHLPQTLPSPKLLLTVRECAAMTSLSEKTILRLISRRKIRALSSIRHKRIPVSELARFIREHLN